MNYSRIVSAVYGSIWAIQPEKLQAILDFVQAKVDGTFHIDTAALEEIRAANAARRSADANSSGAVAVLPVYGTIMHRASMMGDLSSPGGTSTEQLGRQLESAISNPNVKAVVFDIDSPGGTVDGVAELADQIYQARAKKPITAVSNALMASAAYWIGASCSDIAVTPSGQVGSIGVFGAHQDVSQALEKGGTKVTLISAGKYKTEGNPYEPLSDDARAAMQAMVDDYYGMFVKAVARGRGVKADDVRGGFGEGRMVSANGAVKSGMADRVATLDQVLAGYGVSPKGARQAMAAATEQGKLDAQKRRLELAAL